MENKIDIAKILNDCPKGMELDCTMYDNAQLDHVLVGHAYPIKIQTPDGITSLNKNGCYSDNKHAKCIIFPKGKTTWEGFQRPFKDGDILSNGICICLYNGNESDKYYGFYVGVGHIDYPNYFINHPQNSYFTKENSRLATEEEKAKLFQAIKDNGYVWNKETKTLEKLPKFKVGDKIKYKNGKNIDGVEQGVIISITDDTYDVAVTNDMGIFVPITDQYEWELIPNKFDIANLKPFEKVLVRQNVNGKWGIDFFGFYTEGYYYTTGSSIYVQCIPYEENKHLIGTTNDCDECFKTWE